MTVLWHASHHGICSLLKNAIFLQPASVMFAVLLSTVCAAQQPQDNGLSTADETSRKYYMLQIGIYRFANGADAIIKRLQTANFDFYQREKYITAGGKTRYRVRIGPFASRQQTDEAIAAVSKLGVEPLLLERQGTPPRTVVQARRPQHKIVGIPPATAKAAPLPQAPAPAAPAQPGQAQQPAGQPRQAGPAGQAPRQAQQPADRRQGPAAQPQQPSAQGRQQASQSQPQRVGQAPPEKQQEKPPEVQAIAELGGVLTPKGSLILEPLFEYSNSQVNRATFQGVAIGVAALIGVFEIEDADRDITSVSLTGRYGISNRLELELKVPYMWRDDKLTKNVPQAETAEEPFSIESSLQGDGLGDVEAALHYQLNRGQNGWPFLVGNLRYKADTGEGPFDVKRDIGGNETELATGSGFEAIEPSLTILYPSDPGMFFANVGYLFALKSSVDKTFGEQSVGDYESGDTVRVNFGMAYAMNDRASFTLGFKQDFIEKSEVTINDVEITSSDLKVGSFLLGFALQPSSKVSINLNLEFGVTADAPDVRVTLRLPYSF